MNNKFAFVHVNKESIKNTFQKYIKSNWVSEIFKVWLLLFVFFLLLLFYLYNWNLASTRWYFLRKAIEQKHIASFNLDIYNTQKLELKQKNWDYLQDMKYNENVVKINTNIVYINIDDWRNIFASK